MSMKILYAGSPQASQITLNILYDKQKECGFEMFKKLGKTIENWSEETARMFRFTKSNGITEGFHRKMKLIQR